MLATVMYGPGDVRVKSVPDARLVEPTDALVRVTHAAICGSDLWPYHMMEPSAAPAQMGHVAVDVLEGRIEPGRVFDLPLPLVEATAGYRAMDERRSLKALLHP